VYLNGQILSPGLCPVASNVEIAQTVLDFFALGAFGLGGPNPVAVHYLSREVMYGILAMDTFALG
jgi:hypothetical protein